MCNSRRDGQAKQRGRMADHILRRGRIIITDVVNRTGGRLLHRRFQNLRNIIHMDAAENLPRLDDQARSAIAHLFERAATGAINARKPKDVQRQAKRLPLPLGDNANAPPLCAGGQGGAFIHPTARMIAVNPCGGQIAHPDSRSGGKVRGMFVQHRIAIRSGGDG